MQNRKIKSGRKKPSQPRPLIPSQLKRPLATRSKWPWTPMHCRSATWTLRRGRYFQMMEAPDKPRKVTAKRVKLIRNWREPLWPTNQPIPDLIRSRRRRKVPISLRLAHPLLEREPSIQEDLDLI